MFKLFLKLDLLSGSSLSNACLRHDPNVTRTRQRKKAWNKFKKKYIINFCKGVNELKRATNS